jgi:hypothetical protein
MTLPYRTCDDCGARPSEHLTAHVTTDQTSACVDAGLAPLMVLLWGAGIRTEFSCQGGPDQRGYLVFVDAGELEQFFTTAVGAAGSTGDRALLGRLLGCDALPDDTTATRYIVAEHVWSTTVHPSYELAAGLPCTYGPMRYRVAFPADDIARLTTALTATLSH